MAERSVAELLKEKKIYQVINPRLVTAAPTVTVREAIAEMQDKKSGYIVLAEGKKVEGIFTEVDVTQKILEKGVSWDEPVSKFMTAKPQCLSPKDTVGKAIDLMGSGKFYHIPLVDENQELTGILSVRSLIRFLAEFYPTEIYNLPPSSDQVMGSREGG